MRQCLSMMVVGSVISPNLACSKYRLSLASVSDTIPTSETTEFLTRSAKRLTSQAVCPMCIIPQMCMLPDRSSGPHWDLRWRVLLCSREEPSQDLVEHHQTTLLLTVSTAHPLPISPWPYHNLIRCAAR
jgi:hypothetical protein